jgi:hypothetical protein
MTALQKPEAHFYHSPRAARPVQSCSAVTVQRPAVLAKPFELFAKSETLKGQRVVVSSEKPSRRVRKMICAV